MSRRLEYNATLVERSDLTPELAVFVLRPDATPEGNWFTPGQYLVAGLNLSDDPERRPIERPLTMTSATQERERVEFLIRRIARPDSETPLTHALWAMPAGARLHLRPKPAGRFYVDRWVGGNDSRRVLCVAADTGLAPFVSLVRTLQRAGRTSELSRVTVLHGAEAAADLAYRDELSAMADELGLVYLPCVRRAGDAGEWDGDTGNVEDFFAPERLGALEDRLGLDRRGLTADAAVVYACGLRQAIAGSILHLLGRGFVPDHRRIRKAIGAEAELESSFFFEQFDEGPVLNAKDAAVAADLRERFHRASEGSDAGE